MKKFQINDYLISLNIRGADRYEKVSFPIRYGYFSEIQTKDFIFQFNLNGEIKYISGKNTFQIESGEWLKRTQANDWVFYSSGGYNGAIQTIGEHYIPCFTYQTNAVTGGNPFKNGFLESALSSFSDLTDRLQHCLPKLLDADLAFFLDAVVQNNIENLQYRAEKFHSITSGEISVLPPDARHVDYDLIPVNISEGCIYNCKFCSVKTGKKFKKKSKTDINRQIDLLKEFYGQDIKNYNSLFLGQHDALYAGIELIEYTAFKAFHEFNFASSNIKGRYLFFFGSADSILKISDEDLMRINKLPYETFINIGLETFDEKTLLLIGKPVSAEKINLAFTKMLYINSNYPNIEITANFIIGDELPDSHYKIFPDLIKNISYRCSGKGAIYISPFKDNKDRKKMLAQFKTMKNQCRLPAFLYVIQRL